MPPLKAVLRDLGLALRTALMDSHTISALERLEVVEMGRRRRWSDDEKLRIVLESLSGPRLVSVTARRHRISRSLLVMWRRTFLAEQSRAETSWLGAGVRSGYDRAGAYGCPGTTVEARSTTWTIV